RSVCSNSSPSASRAPGRSSSKAAAGEVLDSEEPVMPLERRFALRGLTLAGREWGREDGLPVLALHGWLDNAGRFDLLAPLLRGCRVVALEAAGQGASDFRSADSGYNLGQDVGDLIGG